MIKAISEHNIGTKTVVDNCKQKKYKHIMKKIILLLLMVLAFSGQSIGQTDQGSKSTRKRDSIWLEQALERKTKQLISKKDTLANESLKASKQYAENADKLTDKFLTITGVILAFVGLAGSFGLFITFRIMKNEVEQKFKKELEKLSNDNLETINRLIKNDNAEEQLRKQCQIIVVSQSNEEVSEAIQQVVGQFGNKVGFETKSFRLDTLDELDGVLSKTNFNLLVFHNPNETTWTAQGKFKDSKEEKKLIHWVNQLADDIAVMHFGVYLDTALLIARKRTLFSTTNMEGQLFGNLMNLLKYQDIVRRTK